MLGTRIDAAKLDKISAGFAGQTLSRNCLAGALARVEAERAAGHRVVLATASYAFYVRQIAKLIGVEDVIATRTTDRDGVVSPKIDGENCYGAAKLRMVQSWLAKEKIDRAAVHIRFFSDHVSDAPCMDFADEGFATNAHAPLRALAARKGWQILDWV
jgi:HAD superfamily phosphoserine phosphatase-like hydrolase